MKSQPGNVPGGTLTFYLVATAWITARRRDGEQGIWDGGALLVPLAVGAVTVTYGLEAAISQTGLTMDIPLALTFSLVPRLCLPPRGTFACSCAAVFLAHNVAPGIFGACALHYSSPHRPYSWHGNKYSPLCCARQAYFFS